MNSGCKYGMTTPTTYSDSPGAGNVQHPANSKKPSAAMVSGLAEGVKRSRPVRLRDIAELAGVHVTAVSAVLSPRSNTRTRVSESTAARIRELAARLNYRPHMAAQMMKRRRSGIIGLLEYFQSEPSLRRTDALARELRNRGYHVLRINARWYGEMEEALEYFLNSQVEGVIFVMMGGTGLSEKVLELIRAGIACVGFNGIRFPGIPQVRTDMRGGMKIMVEHLLKLGHRRLGLIHKWSLEQTDDDHSWPALARMEGFERGVLEAQGALFQDIDSFNRYNEEGIVGLCLTEPPEAARSARHGYAMTRRLLENQCKLDALICCNDGYALGALRACYEHQVRVPEDMAVVGMNGEVDTEYYSPPLTTVDLLADEDVKVVLDLLFRLMQGELPLTCNEIVWTSCRLIVRDSCGAHSGKSRQ